MSEKQIAKRVTKVLLGLEIIPFCLPVPIHATYGGKFNGYCAIPKGHPCFALEYGEIYNKYDIDIHGGLTYLAIGTDLRNAPEKVKEMWIVGFDTLHSGDEGRWQTEQEVMVEVKRLKLQLEKINK